MDRGDWANCLSFLVENKMASLLFTLASTLFSAGINAVAFTGAIAGFSMLRDDGGKERKRHDLEEEQFQRARDKWNED